MNGAVSRRGAGSQGRGVLYGTACGEPKISAKIAALALKTPGYGATLAKAGLVLTAVCVHGAAAMSAMEEMQEQEEAA